MAINFEGDAALASDITVDQLKTISDLARKQMELQQRIENGTALLKDLNKQLTQVAEVDLPDAMAAAGMEAFTLDSGHAISIAEKLYASFPKSGRKKAEALNWMADNDLQSLIKEDVVVPFDKGDHDKVIALISQLENSGYDTFSVTESVNTGSLKSAIKELMEQGVTVPLDTLGAYFVRRAEVKL